MRNLATKQKPSDLATQLAGQVVRAEGAVFFVRADGAVVSSGCRTGGSR
jgi:hypothetical protein